MNHFSFSNLSCQKGYQPIFNNKSYHLKSGDILQLLGANGCGKTSLLKIIAQLNYADEGSLHYNEQALNQTFLNNSYYLGHESALNPQLSCFENMHFLVSLKQPCHTNDHINEIKTALEHAGLSHCMHTLARYLSAGQKKLSALASLSLVNADIWLLDEPFSALDNQAVNFVKTLIQSHSKNGGICIFTSHQSVDLPALTLSL